MQKLIVFLITLFIASTQLNAQMSISDSLKIALDNYPNNDTTRVIKMYRYAVSLRNDQGKAIKVFNEAIDIAKSVNWNKGLVDLYLAKANMESLLEKYDASIISLLAAQKIAEDHHFTHYFFGLEFNFTESYRLMQDYQQAGYHAKKALDLALASKSEYDILGAEVLLGGVYKEKNQWDSAAPLLDSAMQLAIRTNDEYMQQQIISHKADHLISIKDYPEALQLYRQNLLYQLKTNDRNGIAWVYCTMSRLFADLDHKDSAYYYGEHALQLSKQYNLSKEVKDSYEALYVCHYKFGDYKKALEYRLIFDSIYNSNNNLQAGQNAERARLEMEQQRKDALSETARIKNEASAARTKNLLFGFVVFFILIAGFLYWSNRQKQKAKSKIEQAYSELKLTQAQLIQSEKMASLGELTAGIAHEIQNPLNFVNNFSEVNKELIEELVEEVDKGNVSEVRAIANDIKENEEKINHHGKRADAIVKGMLQHSRSSSGQKEPTDINALCDEYLRLAYHGLRAKDKSFNATLKTDYDETIEKINVIAQDIGRVVLNLITNAFYVVKTPRPPKGEIEFQPTVSVSTKIVNGKVEIRVSDNGTGIPTNILDKIFQPFFTTKPTGQGTGLGLSLSYDIIKAHGGELKVETKEGAGTTFIIQLPIH